MSGKGGKGSHRKCEICGVRERHHSESLLFSQFPLDDNRCKAWVRAAGNEELVHLPIEKLHQLRHICGKHFKKKDFNKKGTRLKKHAIPILNLTTAPLSDAQLIGFPQHMRRNRNDSPPEELPSTSHQQQMNPIKMSQNVVAAEEPCIGLSSHQVETESRNVAAPEEPCPGTSTSNIEPRNEPIPTYSTKRRRDCDTNQETIKKKRKLEESKCKDETVPVINSDLLTPRKKKLMEQLNKTKCTLNSLRRSAKLIEQIESPVLKEIVLNASKNQHRKPKGRRWTTQNKISALAIFKRSPKTYRYLNTLLPLPSERTLQNILKKIPMHPGINKAVLDHMNANDRDSKDNVCCLIFDEMAVKPRLLYNIASDIVEGYEDFGEKFGRSSELADHALVFMVQGLRQKFKQPVAFYFVKGTISSQKLANIIKEVITEVSAAKFRVLNTVCDQGPTNMGALKLLRDSSGPIDDASNHYFKVNGEKICIVYDVPHLFKSIRNNFQKNGAIILNGRKAHWSLLKEVEQNNRNFLYFSKITSTHIDPKYRAKMKIKYAAQILSNTVAAVLKLMSGAEKEPSHSKELMESGLVIQDLDRLFDVTNGPSCPDNVKKGQRENVSLKTDHMNKWTYWMQSLSTLKFINKNGNEAKNVKCVEGFLITLKSLRDIWQSLRNLGYKYFNLRQANQDALENLFGIIRQSSPTNRNPTCAHFMAALKTAVITKFTSHHSRGSNCEADKKVLLTYFHNLIFVSEDQNQTEEINVAEEASHESDKINYPVMSIPEEDLLLEDDLINMKSQPIIYVSGYIASIVLKKYKCERCSENLKVENPPKDVDIYKYIELREWWQDKRSLTYPSVAL